MIRSIAASILVFSLAFFPPPVFGRQMLFKSESYTLADSFVVEGKNGAVVESSTRIRSSYTNPDNTPFSVGEKPEPVISDWNLTKDISAFPQYHSNQLLVDALYNKALEEMLLDVRMDGAFMAGAKWDGVWTRDISYSIILSLAIINPDAAKVSLKAKVMKKRIIQDTGTGGSWPISTDRMVWALAAWEVYLVTGDHEWLQYTYAVVKSSAEEDLKNALDVKTGLMDGESSFLDWREQTYPRWMDPKDIYQSHALGTNAVHCRTYQILAEMAKACGEIPKKYFSMAEGIKSGINTVLWLQEKGYYGQYFYGRTFRSVSPKTEALGEALTVLFDIADGVRASKIIACTPVLNYGTPCIYPQIPHIPPYHNNAIWPFVESFWVWASAKAGNDKSVAHGLASIYRAAALFITNKENMTATTGGSAGTQINSDRQLWSVAGCLATIYRVFYGMTFTQEGLSFAPFVPPAYTGEKSLTNFKYRDALLTISLKGTGHTIQSVALDGVVQKKAFLRSTLKGRHQILIVLGGNHWKETTINLVRNEIAPECPEGKIEGNNFVWNKVDDAEMYFVYKNGKKLTESRSTLYTLPANDQFAEYQVMAVNGRGLESFLSEPQSILSPKNIFIFDASSTGSQLQTEVAGFSKKGYIRLEKNEKQKVVFTAQVARTGLYRIDVRYSNGNGPINTENKCALRTLSMNGKPSGSIVMPQRGTDNWSDWGYSNSLYQEIKKGINKFEISFSAVNNNMNEDVNTALLDQLRLTLIKEK